MSFATTLLDGNVALGIVLVVAAYFVIGFLASMLVTLAFVPQNQFNFDWQLIRSSLVVSVGWLTVSAFIGALFFCHEAVFSYLSGSLGMQDLLTPVICYSLPVVASCLMIALTMWVWKWDVLTGFWFVLCLGIVSSCLVGALGQMTYLGS